MYRVLLSRTGVAYAKECDDELDEFDFYRGLKRLCGFWRRNYVRR